MSLIKCCECNTKVSEYAEKCPTCGCPISVIKNKRKDNKYLITFNDGESIDLTDIENKILENELSSPKLWSVLENDYEADIATCSTIDSMLEFNNYKFPENYQDLYDAMCKSNVKSREAREASLPKCPHCNSTNISKISTAKKATKIGLFGIFGTGDIGKTYKCNNCGSRF